MKLTEKQIEVLEILENNSARIPVEDIAKMAQLNVAETETILDKLEEMKVLVRFNSVIDWSKVDGHEGVTAMIDVKVAPKRGVGFDEVAQRIYRFKEVRSVYLMSGAYDLSVIIEGRSMNEVARFVSEKLSTLDSVLSTTTHFILKKYKHDGTIFEQNEDDKRIVVSP
ncbi:Lrp/AsnC family transcriptional regulator [Cytobacillus firmus]|uniref:Lrp/AsnC family transcriptional regulator n=1 Tax=Cytobacillus firmus TaxID=1399 RepID=A0AA46SI78_CYTFI|nr:MULTISPECIES: Lrp/AsnC family transcriptional regulator [Bacillales]KML36286.1 AsnC family transcriptional regulator [Cytobacillus firmus]MBG9446955.1 AsnC family transcriptional regulator [Cytobacillus firmus]MBG9452458.1 AsnC family transcriptional regulator [Cytobacillus firmus]MBY6052439.1 Lrp/AsnC family transcriptional regulator [Cytobacillus firmus]MCC3648833.1 Lrp/AsnC family transcriptional regulator [Cytobacillus oceanisediminis]